MVTVSATEAPPSGPKLESLAHIDLSKLSQSELLALSLCSAAAFDLSRTNDVVTPQIDRTIFNESAGSRRQTYSRLRLATAAAGHRCRLPNPRALPTLASHDPEHAENKSIVNFLKQLIGGNEIKNSQPRQLLLPPPHLVVSGNTDRVPPPNCAQDMQIVLYSGERKRKRERKRKQSVTNETRLEIVNKNGAAVDLRALENADELYGAEFRRRSIGLESEEEVLGVLRNLEGQWGSRRKKRKIVDAGEFGDSLPIGWKLLLALKRREGRVSLYCRRYVSPNGQQFVSCKEAASYLRSYFGLNDATQQLNQTAGSNQQVHGVTSENHTGFPNKNGDVKHDFVPNSMLPSSSTPNVQEMELSLLGIENLPEVQVRDLFECYKCNLTFDEKDTYLKHLMSFHQRTTRRYRLGSSIGEGVIIKDGKYECQICHKVFEERRSYNGHVGVHVRSNVRSPEELPGQATVQKSTESPFQDGSQLRISKMDALVEIAQSSILDTSPAELNDKAIDGSSPRTLKVVTVSETNAANSDHELSLCSDPNEMESEDGMTKSTPDQGFNQHDGKYITEEEKEGNDHFSDVENHSTAVCPGTFEFTELNEVEKRGNSEREIGLGSSQLIQSHDAVGLTSDQTVRENVLQSGIADSSIAVVPSVHCFPSANAISNKGENEFCTVDQKLDNVTGFDELRFDDIETLNFGFVNRQESSALPDVSMNLANDEAKNEGFNSAAQFEPETFMFNIVGTHQFTTVCVWCRIEFNHEAVDSEIQSDSVGFMCPACKARISGQLNVLDGGLSMNFHL